ncbi:eCIS core domain-containing protein [Azotobacter salinestris]|uniref:eCIS core domain-containing protein n=1 Tax=Azotobacter salinestris TaxID=69964 RepID=UPI0032DEDAFD
MARHSAIVRGLRVAGLVLGLCAGIATGGEAGGGIVDPSAPQAGMDLDELHRQIKALIPPAQAAQGAAAFNETLVQAGAPVLLELIVHSRDEALRNGVEPMPADIRRQLTGFLPERVLEAARYRVQGGDDFTLQWNLIRYGDTQAIALDHVVVFKEASDALYNPTLWAHELTHVDQYQRWGIPEFAIRYLRNYEAVEREAYEAETRYVAWARLHGRQRLAASGEPGAERPAEPLPAATSSTCGTAAATCRVEGSGPIGTPCWCNLPSGAAAGSLVPDPAAAPPANACSSARGTCPLDGEIATGSPCTCVTAEGSFPGTAERRSLGDRCATYSGTCPLATPLLSGEPCYCPGRTGAVEGYVP